MDERTTITAAQNGDRRAMIRLLNDYRRVIEAAVSRSLVYRGSYEDVVQNTLCRVVHSIGSFEFRSRFSSWLYRIAVNESFRENTNRKREVEKLVIDTELVEGLREPTEECLYGDLSRRRLGEIIRDASKDMSPAAKTAFEIYYLDHPGIRVGEAAQMLGISPDAFSVRLHKARAVVKRHLARYRQDGVPETGRSGT